VGFGLFGSYLVHTSLKRGIGGLQLDTIRSDDDALECRPAKPQARHQSSALFSNNVTRRRVIR
jgi:hypothetical protein